MQNSLAMGEHTVYLQITETESTFTFKQPGITKVTLPVGFGLVSNAYFKHTPPTYSEIEYAINFIEDEIEKIVPMIPVDGFRLVSETPFIKGMASLAGVSDSDEMILSRDSLECLFGLYAEIAMGKRPSAYEPDISPKFYAQLLMLREFMHHLKFAQITTTPTW
ncbi:hypothetical protein [Hydrogenovibrio marinus]|uniref:Uncharacterized protein n=1 Tax=Hydrogenovibrio marinus TaxID=28885 RepID=A0A066ZRW9_HYDMR|nr:hypothetical protein [Hydrogenovibrio marinus]KDN95029.1 hypothetical protein EI16_01580 [Hydrogenovibrio marinus]BBN59495.1 hypothetical protein HVMH_1089 [Hydrogenovibrio marinus]